MKRLLVAATAGCLGLVGCATATGGGSGTTGANTPRPRTSSAPNSEVVSSGGGRGPAISFQSINNAGYTLRRLDSLTLHLPGGATEQQSLDRLAFLRITLTGEAANTYRVTIVLDSMQATASAIALTADSLAPVRGTRWTGTVSATGQLSPLVANRSTRLGDQLTNQLRLLFPTLPSDGARAGTEWSDSTRFPLKSDEFDAMEAARTTYRAVEDDKGIKVESNGTYQRAGKGMQFNRELEMAASGKRQGTHRISRDGVLLGAEGSEAGDMTITVLSTGQTVPVNQTGRYTIRATGR